MLDDELQVTAEVIKAGNANLLMQQCVYRDGELLCRGEVKIVCVDKQTVKPKRIPREMLAALKH
jgi:acyl-CoA thioesterase FadM